MSCGLSRRKCAIKILNTVFAGACWWKSLQWTSRLRTRTSELAEVRWFWLFAPITQVMGQSIGHPPVSLMVIVAASYSHVFLYLVLFFSLFFPNQSINVISIPCLVFLPKNSTWGTSSWLWESFSSRNQSSFGWQGVTCSRTSPWFG